MHFGGGGFNHFDMHSAEDIFKEFFGGRNPFDNFFDDDDEFFNGFGGMQMGSGMQMGGGFGSMGGMGGMGMRK